MRLTVTLLALLCAGCVTGIPDYYPPPPKPEPCEVWIIVRPDNTARCVSRERMRRELCGKIVQC